jgi:hypothetical protein
MGRRSRARGRSEKLEAPAAAYPMAGGGELELRCVLSAKTRTQYSEITGSPAAGTEDVWHRRAEFLFERLAVRWQVAGVEWEGQRELLDRFRAASHEERDAVRGALREHCTEWFPEVEAP